MASIWSVAMIDVLPLLIAFAMAAGAAGYFLFPAEPPIWSLWPGLLSLVGVLVVFRHWPVPASIHFVVWMLFGIVLGGCAASFRAHLVLAPVIQVETGPVMLEGWLEEVEPGAKGPRLRIDVHAIAGFAAEDTPAVVRLTHRSRLEVSSGRFVRCWAVLRPPPAPTMAGEYDFQRQAYFQRLGAVGYVQGRCRGGALGAPNSIIGQLKLAVSAFRRQLAAHVDTAAGERAGGFAAALVSGDRSYMRAEDQDALRNSGLAHLLAISGLHMAIVGGLVFLIMRRVLACIEPLALRIAVQKPAAVVALVASLAYLVVSGASVSTQRAFIMSAVVFGAVLFDRAALSLRSFAIAMILVVLLQPESVMTPGFQMSFAASGALIATYEAWNSHRAGSEKTMGPISYSWASLAVTSIVAGAATAPFALYHFDRLAGLGLIANFTAMPVITFASAPTAALALLLSPFGLQDFGLRLFGYSLEIILEIARRCSDYAPAGVAAGKQMPGISLVFFSSALAMGAVARGWGRFVLMGLPCVPAIALWFAAPATVLHWSASGDVFIRSAGGDMMRIEYTDGNGLSPMRFSRLDATNDACEGWPCLLETPVGTISLPDPEGPASHCVPRQVAKFELRPPSSPEQIPSGKACAVPIYWNEVLKSGGLTLKENDLTLATAKACQPRPWKPCRTENS